MGTFDLPTVCLGCVDCLPANGNARHAATRQLTDGSTAVGPENAVTFDNPDFMFAKSRTLFRGRARGWRQGCFDGAARRLSTFRFHVAQSAAGRAHRYQRAASGRRDGNAHFKRSSKREFNAIRQARHNYSRCRNERGCYEQTFERGTRGATRTRLVGYRSCLFSGAWPCPSAIYDRCRPAISTMGERVALVQLARRSSDNVCDSSSSRDTKQDSFATVGCSLPRSFRPISNPVERIKNAHNKKAFSREVDIH
jgi:hypothetical protein